MLTPTGVEVMDRGRPRNPWIQQIGDDTPFSIRAERSRARCRGVIPGCRNGPRLSTRFDDDDDDDDDVVDDDDDDDDDDDNPNRCRSPRRRCRPHNP